TTQQIHHMSSPADETYNNRKQLFTSTIKTGTFAPEDALSTLNFEATRFETAETPGTFAWLEDFPAGKEAKEMENAEEDKKIQEGNHDKESPHTLFADQAVTMASGQFANTTQNTLAQPLPQSAQTISPLLKSMSLVIIDAPSSSSLSSPPSSSSHPHTNEKNNLDHNMKSKPSEPLIRYDPSLDHEHPNSVTNLLSPNSPYSNNHDDVYDSYSIYDDPPLPTKNASLKIVKAPDSITNITGELGGTVFLPCSAHHSMEKQVSWVRRRDWHILTSGTVAYTKEERFTVHHPEGSTDWTLVIKYLEREDTGTYECQVSTGNGLLSRLVELDVVVPRAVIPGNGEYHIDSGSTITLDCYIHQNLVAPQYIFWYHNSRMINYDRERGGVNVRIDTGPQVRSRLTVARAIPDDSGNYTCAAANTQPASTTVYVSY
ncbi:hypothetical protein SK128_028154, partial [Halocaridina rubra]